MKAIACPHCNQSLRGREAANGTCPACGLELDAAGPVRTQKRGHRGAKQRRSSRRKRTAPKPSLKIKAGDATVVYVDGSCRDANEGGWAFAYHDSKGDLISRSGCVPDTTNNRMELLGVLKALQHFPHTESLIVVSDSQYTINGCTQWVQRWKLRDWRTTRGDPVKNQDLWEELDAELKRHGNVRFKWVRGHNGNPMNELCDMLASAESALLKGDLS